MRKMIVVAVLLCCSLFAFCQDQGTQPVVNININVSRSVTAVNFQTNTSSKVDFKQHLYCRSPKETQKSKIKRACYRWMLTSRKCLRYANRPELLTYVLWAITPEGRSSNLGEVQLNGDKGKLSVTTRLPNFAMIVTAEPYFAVTSPSELVVLQSIPRSDTKGGTTPVTATLLKRSAYSGGTPLEAFSMDPKVPLAVYEARNALRIAKGEGAEKYAPDAWAKASQTGAQMEDYIARKQKNPILTAARNVTQQAEDARSIAVKNENDEKIAAEKRAQAEKLAQQQKDAELQQQQAAQREAELKAQQEAEAKRAAEEAQAAHKRTPQKSKLRMKPQNRPRQRHRRSSNKNSCAPSCWRNSMRSCKPSTHRADS